MKTHILITGASRGIGAAIADALATDAAKVVALSSADGDLGDPAIPDQLWAKSLDRLDGRIDVLVNNAGVFEANPVGASDADWLESWNRTLQINLTAAALLCRRAVQLLTVPVGAGEWRRDTFIGGAKCATRFAIATSSRSSAMSAAVA